MPEMTRTETGITQRYLRINIRAKTLPPQKAKKEIREAVKVSKSKETIKRIKERSRINMFL